jgi:hypothetical protein
MSKRAYFVVMLLFFLLAAALQRGRNQFGREFVTVFLPVPPQININCSSSFELSSLSAISIIACDPYPPKSTTAQRDDCLTF